MLSEEEYNFLCRLAAATGCFYVDIDFLNAVLIGKKITNEIVISLIERNIRNRFPNGGGIDEEIG